MKSNFSLFSTEAFANASSHPTLIFAEDHGDPITGKILIELLPKLKSLGYVFYDEIPASMDLALHMSQIEKECDYFEKHHFTSYQINKCAPYHEARLTLKPCLEYIKNSGMEYRGIDLNLPPNVDRDEIELYATERNKVFTEAYLQAKNPVIGRHGINHILPIQKNILKSRPLALAQQQYQFINIYSEPEYSLDEIIADSKRQQRYPLDILVIDAKNTKIEEIVNQIMNKISNPELVNTNKPKN